MFATDPPGWVAPIYIPEGESYSFIDESESHEEEVDMKEPEKGEGGKRGELGGVLVEVGFGKRPRKRTGPEGKPTGFFARMVYSVIVFTVLCYVVEPVYQHQNPDFVGLCSNEERECLRYYIEQFLPNTRYFI